MECYDVTCLKVPQTLDLSLQYMQYLEVCIGLVFKLFYSRVTFGDERETHPVYSEVSSKHLSFHSVLKCVFTSLLRSDCAFLLCKVNNLSINSLYMQNMLCF